MRGFPGDQRFGMAGAIEQQIGAEIFCDVVGDRIDAIDDPSPTLLAKRVSGMVRGSDGLALRIPFRRDGVRDPARRAQRHGGRRACGSACRRA